MAIHTMMKLLRNSVDIFLGESLRVGGRRGFLCLCTSVVELRIDDWIGLDWIRE